MALEALNTIRNYYCISEFQTEDGLRKTIWRGRIEILEKDPLVICDGAPDNARALSSKDLAECVRKYHHDVEERQRLKECLEEVKQQADKEDVIIICGTLSFQNELK